MGLIRPAAVACAAWLREVNLHVSRDMHSEFAGVPNRCGSAGGADDTLGRHTSHIQAVAAHQAAFDQCHLRTKSRCSGSGHQARSTGADHDQIVTAGWSRDSSSRADGRSLQAED